MTTHSTIHDTNSNIGNSNSSAGYELTDYEDHENSTQQLSVPYEELSANVLSIEAEKEYLALLKPKKRNRGHDGLYTDSCHYNYLLSLIIKTNMCLFLGYMAPCMYVLFALNLMLDMYIIPYINFFLRRRTFKTNRVLLALDDVLLHTQHVLVLMSIAVLPVVYILYLKIDLSDSYPLFLFTILGFAFNELIRDHVSDCSTIDLMYLLRKSHLDSKLASLDPQQDSREYNDDSDEHENKLPMDMDVKATLPSQEAISKKSRTALESMNRFASYLLFDRGDFIVKFLRAEDDDMPINVPYLNKQYHVLNLDEGWKQTASI